MQNKETDDERKGERVANFTAVFKWLGGFIDLERNLIRSGQNLILVDTLRTHSNHRRRLIWDSNIQEQDLENIQRGFLPPLDVIENREELEITILEEVEVNAELSPLKTTLCP